MIFSPSPTQERKLSEYGEAFLDFLQEKHIPHLDLARIQFACEKIESDFKNAKKVRKNGESYESHPYEVTRLYIDFSGKHLNTNTFIACLLHDHIEDISQESYETISQIFNPDIAFLVHLLSKPRVEGADILSKENYQLLKKRRNIAFFENFKSISSLGNYIVLEAQKLGYKLDFSGDFSSILDIVEIIARIKICDRIHNLYTIEDFSPHEIQGKIDETEKYLIPLAHELCREDTKILDMLRKALISTIRATYKKTFSQTFDQIQ